MHNPQEPSAPPKRPPLDRQVPPTLFAVCITSTSRRGLAARWYVVTCPACRLRRVHVADGIRRCPCGRNYRLVVGAAV